MIDIANVRHGSALKGADQNDPHTKQMVITVLGAESYIYAVPELHFY
jgi:hypothetical protein